MFASDLSLLCVATKGNMPPHSPTKDSPVWGFLVYRTTYADQDLWEKYINYITRAVLHEVDFDSHVPEVMRAHKTDYFADNPKPGLLEHGRVIRDHFHLCTKEGPEYDGKTIEEIRDIHVQWLESLPDEAIWHNADGSHNCGDVANKYKRYFGLWPRYCHGVYVDEQALTRFSEAWKEDEYRDPYDPGSRSRVSVAVFRAVDAVEIQDAELAKRDREMGWPTATPPVEDDEDDDFEGIDEEGQPVEAPDGLGERLWMYVRAADLAHFYEELLHFARDRRFIRPPKIWSSIGG